MEYLIVKWLHILSSTLLFGTGIGSAFYLFYASLGRSPHVVASVARLVVRADWLFTATTIVFQPLSGLYLAHLANLPLRSAWLAWSIWLYVVALACWLPVVRLQYRMRDLAQQAAVADEELPSAYWRCFRRWVALGFPALFAFVAVFYLMTVKPG